MRLLILAMALAITASTAMARSVTCSLDNQSINLPMLENTFQLIDIDDTYPGIVNFGGKNIAAGGNPLSYSNFCDNWMEITFPNGSFEALKKGERTTIHGAVFYSQSELTAEDIGAVPSPYNDEEYMIVEKVTCKLDL